MALAALVLAAGCGVEPWRCPAPGPFLEVTYDDFGLSCSDLHANVEKAGGILVRRHLVPDLGFLALVTLHVGAERTVGFDATGIATPGHIELGRWTESLAHEALHQWDYQHGALGTVAHLNWDRNGYDEASEEYAQFTAVP